ncbi:unnamed protein product [Leptosia nina]|uniref:Uncharacterized protein n=1 Tax=Leptosia nina TaxID=320188 RepID=A0AAV1IVB0_9NEOP
MSDEQNAPESDEETPSPSSDMPLTNQPTNEPVMTQPLSRAEQPLDSEDEEEKKRRDNADCCFDPWLSDDVDIFFLCRCIAECCVGIGECTEGCCEGCAECIASCCESGTADAVSDNNECDCNCFD